MKKYIWKEHGTFGDSETLEGAGSVIAAWNLCEISMLGLLSQIMKGPSNPYYKTWSLMNNNQRCDLLSSSLSSFDHLLAPCVEAYLTHYRICQGNRNIVAHGIVRPAIFNNPQVIIKHKKNSTEQNAFAFDAQTMFRIANECYQTYQLGVAILNYGLVRAGHLSLPDITANHLGPLPKIPEKPKALDGQSPELVINPAPDTQNTG